MNEFWRDLARSYEVVSADEWQQIYKVGMNAKHVEHCPDDLAKQLIGIDAVITTHSGKTITVDEKVIEHEAETILLEIEHRKDNGTTTDGWLKKLIDGTYKTDVIAYYRPYCECCFLIPAKALATAYTANEWYARDLIPAHNTTWTTYNLILPLTEVLPALPSIRTVMKINNKWQIGNYKQMKFQQSVARFLSV